MFSIEEIIGEKISIEIPALFSPAKGLLEEDQKTHELNPDKPPLFLLIQGRAGIGKSTFVDYVAKEWSKGTLWQERFKWVFVLRLRDLRDIRFQSKKNLKCNLY